MANNITTSSLTIIIWNCNGVIQRKHELEMFLHDNRIDIALISETHLTQRHYFFISGYKVYRADHPDGTGHAGAAILIKMSIVHHVLPLDPTTDVVQAAAVSLKVNGTQISIAAIYCPPRFRNTSVELQNLFSQLGPRFVTGGDFNAKHPRWGSRLSNPRGRQLLNVILDSNCDIHSQSHPTFWPARRQSLPDILDFYVSKGISNINKRILAISELSSDHDAVLMELDAASSLVPFPPQFLYKNINLNEFKENINNNLNLQLPLKTSLQVEAAVEHFTRVIQNAAWSSYDTHGQMRRLHSAPSYPHQIRVLIQLKRRARHKWQRTRLAVDKMEFNRLTNNLKSEISKIKEERFDQQLSQLTTKDGSLWSATKRIMKFITPSSPLRCIDGTWAKSDYEKASLFSEHLRATFQPHPDIIDVGFSEYVTDSLEEPLQLSLAPSPFQLKEVSEAIKHLPNGKTPGHDLISAEILKQLPPVGIKFLLFLFNAVLRITHFPIQWKLSIIVMVLKPNKPPHNPTSYRPISLLPVISKLFERLLLPRIISCLQNSQVIPHHQFGFRSNHSTIQQLQRVIDFVANGLEKKLYSVGVFLDISAAFDRVWHDGLLLKLKHVLPDSYFRIVRSFLDERHFKVKQGQDFSILSDIKAGVPQGAILSPTLYNIYTADIPTTAETLIATYADDTTIMGQANTPEEATTHVQNHLRLLQKWLREWRIKINTDKSVQVTFTLRRRECPPLYINNNRIPQRNSVKYLGLLIDKRLTWKQHLKEKRLALNNRLKILHRLIRSKSTLPLKQKRQIYLSILRPMWTYGAQLFGTAKYSNIKTIQAFQSKFLRLATGAPYYVSSFQLHSDMRLPMVSEVVRWLYRRFHVSLQHHDNPLVQGLSMQHYPTIRRLRRSWSRDLL
jgi:hypothetical protein